MRRKNIDIDGIKSSFSYDEKTGEIIRNKFRGIAVEKPTLKNAKKSKYPMVLFNGSTYLAHRIAWVIKTGEYPQSDIDHINGDKWDNRWNNLRLATRSQNCQNKPICKTNTSGVKGVCWHKSAKKWYAQLKLKGTHVFRKTFDSIEEASMELEKQRIIHHGEFSNNGNFNQ